MEPVDGCPLKPMLFLSSAGVQCFCGDHVRGGDWLPAALGARCGWSLYREEMVFDSGIKKPPNKLLFTSLHMFKGAFRK